MNGTGDQAVLGEVIRRVVWVEQLTINKLPGVPTRGRTGPESDLALPTVQVGVAAIVELSHEFERCRDRCGILPREASGEGRVVDGVASEVQPRREATPVYGVAKKVQI